MAFVPFSQLPLGSAVVGTESVPILQGLSTVRVLARDIARAGTTSGRATLVAGIATVTTTAVTSTSNLFLGAQDNLVAGALRISARTPGVSFVITSSNLADTGLVAWQMFN